MDFLHDDFLLDTPEARELFHSHAKDQGIIDYHNHLIPAQIAQNARFGNLAEVWLGGDHYKWRQMRTNGIPESDITGHAPDWQTFLAWARTVPATLGNPLYHWTHLELKRYFGIDTILNEATAKDIWDRANEVMKGPDFSVAGLLKKMKVRALCTTDDPVDSLEHHLAYAATQPAKRGEALMFPTFRPDKALALEDLPAWKAYLVQLGTLTGEDIRSYEALVAALDQRHAYFHAAGCRLSDHALVVPPVPCAEDQAPALFLQALEGRISPADAQALKGSLLRAVGRMNHRRGWTMQLHMGALRNVNTAMFKKLGPDTGYDAIGDLAPGLGLAGFLDSLALDGRLPRTILYSLNATANDVLATIMGGFQDGTVAGKIQLGSAWWFNDHIDGMDQQLRSLGNLGLLPRFVGMLTDSRSFLSFPRHEYFRRVLCRLLGRWMHEGLAPRDFAYVGGIVSDISFHNAQRYFELPGA